MISAALRYASRGIPVFPLAPGAKVPLKDTRGFHEATTDPGVIRAWWRQHPLANIGAPTGPAGGFWVLDVDLQHDGPAALARIEAEHGALPPTAETSTPSGGRHLYFRWAADCSPELRNSTSRIGPGLDVRADGGSIPMPPSTLRDGRGYRWHRNGTGLAAAPAWLVALALPPIRPPRAAPKPLAKDVSRYVGAAVTRELDKLAMAAPGTRNNALFRSTAALAGFVLAGALPEAWARARLEEAAASIGLGQQEALRTIDSAFRAAQPRELVA